MKNTIIKAIAGFMACVALSSAILPTYAASSSELKDQIEALELEQNAISDRLEELKEKENSNWNSIEEMVDQKNNIDEQIFLIYTQLDNLEDQILEYGQLIAENQQKLDNAEQQLSELNNKYKERIRAMEEAGQLSYWSVLFKANSFTDLIDNLSMVQEIAAADKRMLNELDAAAKQVKEVQAELISQKMDLEQTRSEQQAAKDALDQKRTEADEVLSSLNEERKDLQQDQEAVQAEKNSLVAEIAKAEQEYNEARKFEEEERRRREEEERRRQETENYQKEEQSKPHDKGPENSETEPEPEPSQQPEPKPTDPPKTESQGWLQPCSYICVTSAYGYRSSGWHNGVDFANNRGTPIYATRSGTVTKTRTMQTSYGNHVVINHGDGYSSLYAHMEYYVVSTGQYVHQGDLIGYMGDSGNASGSHLHFTVLYNGSDVNPMQFL